MAAAIDVSAEFQRRRLATWRATRLWLLLGAAAGVAFSLGPKGSDADMSEAQFTFMLVALVAIGVSLTVVVFSVRRLYRCPHCETVPMGSVGMLGPASFGVRRGVALNPYTCPNCGAKLRGDA
jgi:hypothetical protein